MAEDIIKTLSKKSFDLFDNANFFAENVVVTEESISSVNTTGMNTNIYEFGSSTSPHLVGFTTYKELSIFVFEEQVLMFTADTNSFDQASSFTVIDFCVWYKWLLCFSEAGEFLYVNLDDLTTWGENTVLKTDTNFVATGSKIFSVVNHMNFIAFSRDDGYILWTKALITTSPASWTLWSDIGWSANYYYVGEPLHLGSYSSIIGINYNVYMISFTKVEDSIGLVAKKLFSSFGATKNICFSHEAAYLFTSNSVRVYMPRSDATKTVPFQESKQMFTNVEVIPPCKRIYNPTFKVSSILGLTDDYYVHLSDSSKLFLSTYLYDNGDDYYCLTSDVTPLGLARWSSISALAWSSISPTTRAWSYYVGNNRVMYFQFAGATSTPDASMIAELDFESNGTVVAFGYGKIPTQINIEKTSSMWNSNYVETAQLKDTTYPYAVFRGKGVDEYFKLTITGSFIINSMTVGNPNAQSQ